MKKTRKNPAVNDLLIRAIEYIFVEWLRRRGIFSAFKSNFLQIPSVKGNFQDQLRFLIRYTLYCSDYGPRNLLSSAFLFVATPEGCEFWDEHSAAWERFCVEFRETL